MVEDSAPCDSFEPNGSANGCISGLKNIAPGVFTPVLAKHTKYLSFVASSQSASTASAELRTDASPGRGLAHKQAF